jgi:hypothetical protein
MTPLTTNRNNPNVIRLIAHARAFTIGLRMALTNDRTAMQTNAAAKLSIRTPFIPALFATFTATVIATAAKTHLIKVLIIRSSPTLTWSVISD